MSITSFFLAALTLQPVIADPTKDLHPTDRLEQAAHASAVCDCAGPLVNYLAYQLAPANPETPAGQSQSSGADHIAIMRLINERWGQRYDLGGFDSANLDLDYLNRWHFWIEEVQVAHGVTPSYTHMPHAGNEPGKITPQPASRDLGPVITGIRLNCSNCDDAFCDPLRLAVSAQEAIFDGQYRSECENGCANPKDEMRTRFINAIYEGGPGRTGGWTFKITAQQEDIDALRLVHAKLVPVWGEEILLDFSIFGGGIDSDMNILSVMRAYQVHILKPNGEWVFWQWDINQPRLSSVPPYSPYPQCHAFYEPPPADSGPSPGGLQPDPDTCNRGVRPLP
ncbi:MAG: hypothetical protein OEQ74_08275 [Gammaproteobacteria bacterium]|nr:hypothetical protein [Gammaproteobacteria bacterium]